MSAAYSDSGLVADLSSNKRDDILRAFDLVRCMLSPPDPAIDRLIRYGAVPGIVELLGRDDDTEIQAEAASYITCITAGTSDQTKVVIDLGVVPVLVTLLSSPSDDVCGEAVWALGNIAADSIEYRDLVLVHGALVPLLALVRKSNRVSIIKNAAWALSNLCSGKPLPSFDQIQPAIPYLKNFIDSTDTEFQADAFMALSDLSGGTKDMIQAIVETGACSILVKHLDNPPPKSILPKLTFLGNVMRSGIIDIVNPELLERLGVMLEHKGIRRKVKTSVCEIIGCIFSGTEEQVRVAVEGGLLKRLFDRLQYFITDDVKKEALKAILKAVSRVSVDHLKSVLSQTSVQPLCKPFLLSSDGEVVILCLELLDAIMKIGETDIIEANDGFKNIEKLQCHKDNEVREKAAKILHNHRVDKDIAEEFVWVNAPDNVNEYRRSIISKKWCKFPSLIKKITA